MPIATFVPIVQPSPGTTLKPEISLHEVPFGDGYTLSSPNGINHIRHTVSLNWEGLTPNEHNTLRSFFMAMKGYLPFYYTHPTDGVTRKWTCKSWSSSVSVPIKFTAELVENFSLST
jgi:phage-related protein